VQITLSDGAGWPFGEIRINNCVALSLANSLVHRLSRKSILAQVAKDFRPLAETEGQHNLDMCYSVHFHKVYIDTPTNAQPVLLYNDKPTCFDTLGSSSGLYIEYQMFPD
jgi:hypothetical protein